MIDDEKPVSEEPQDIVIDPSETGLAEDESVPGLEVEYVPEAVEAEQEAVSFSSPAPEPVWKKVLQQLLGMPDAAAISQRINELNRAIDDDPESAVNYVLRGEAYLDAKAYTLAYADFQQGLDMAQAQFEQSDWGIVAQTVQDRAMQGLRLAEKHLPT